MHYAKLSPKAAHDAAVDEIAEMLRSKGIIAIITNGEVLMVMGEDGKWHPEKSRRNRKKKVREVPEGCADITATLTPEYGHPGLTLYIEVKTGKATVSRNQPAFRKQAIEAGAMYWAVDNWYEAKEKLMEMKNDNSA